MEKSISNNIEQQNFSALKRKRQNCLHNTKLVLNPEKLNLPLDENEKLNQINKFKQKTTLEVLDLIEKKNGEFDLF